MHPAPSVIIFTVLSGMGFGMLAWLGWGYPAVTGRTAFIFFFVAYALAVGGLMASTFHLGNPQRALRAFTQWRTSWLSREAWMAVISLMVMAIFAIGAIFLGRDFSLVGKLGAILCLVTVFTTSMMYAQLKTVPRWNHSSTSLLFLLYAVTGGALLTGQALAASILLMLTGAAQLLVWHAGDLRFGERGSTLETATGLGGIGKVRQYEPPHTGTNYLLHEFVHVIGRKHARTLRFIGIAIAAVVPALLLSFAGTSHLIAGLAILLHLVGMFVIRWLFFAEAEHVVRLYYDQR